jgi:glycosyltransferase involved in cell wall biosynthesis
VTVAHVFLDFGQGGAQELALAGWRHLDPARYRPALICVRGEGVTVAAARDMKVPVQVLGRLRRPRDGAAVAAIAAALRACGAVIVQTPLYSRVAPYARLAAALAGLPLTIAHEHCRPQAPSRARRLADRLLDRLPGQRYLAVSRADAAWLVARGIDPRRVATVLNGIVVEQYGGEDRAAARAALGLASQDLLLLTPARLHPQKRHADLLAAMALLVDRFPRLRLLCAGGGPLADTLVALAASAGLEARVQFLGWRPDLPRLYAACDLVVLCSEIEGLPLALLEAQAAGRAIVATRVGGVPEAVREDASALLVPSHDPAALAAAIEVLASDSAARMRMGAEGRRLARSHFDIRVHARALQAQYDRWLAEVPRGRRAAA